MKTKINFFNDEEKLRKDFPQFKASKKIKKILNYISNEKEVNMSMSVYLCDSKRIKELNKEYRKINKSTDVLSFSHNEQEGKFLYIGDIFVNKDIIESQAKEINSDPIMEFIFLTMHGILHLIGYDHVDKISEEKMTAKQREILINLNIREW